MTGFFNRLFSTGGQRYSGGGTRKVSPSTQYKLYNLLGHTHTHTRHDTTLLNTWYRLPQRPASARFSSAHFSALIISLVRSTCRYLHPLELNTQNFIISPSPIKIKQKVRRYALLPGTGWRCIPSGHRRPAEEPIYWSYGSFRSHGYCPSHRNHRPQKVPFYDNCSTYLCCVVLQICMIG